MSTSTPSSLNSNGKESISRRRCRQCRKTFQPRTPTHVVCSIECSIKYAPGARQRARKKALKTKANWLDDVQVVFNKYIRLRDQHLPCISCGRFHKGKWDAGHFLSVGSNPELRYCEENVHRQCSPCNTHLSGNQQRFREGLIERIGQERVEWLEGPHDMPLWTIDDLEDLKKKFQKKIKDIESYFPSSEDF